MVKTATRTRHSSAARTARRSHGGPAILAGGPSLLLTLELPQQCLVRGMRAPSWSVGTHDRHMCIIYLILTAQTSGLKADIGAGDPKTNDLRIPSTTNAVYEDCLERYLRAVYEDCLEKYLR